MKIRIYLLKFTVALLAFIFGVAMFGGFRWFQSFRAQMSKTLIGNKVKAPLSDDDIANIKLQIDEQAKSIVSEQEAETPPAPEFDPSGDYYIIEEELSKAFKDLEGMEIVARDYEKISDEMPNGAAIPPKGALQLKKNYNFARISIGTTQLAFETEKINGVHYRFTGTFPQIDSCPISEEDVNVALKGRLVKMKDGKKTAEAEIKFYADCGC